MTDNIDIRHGGILCACTQDCPYDCMCVYMLASEKPAKTFIKLSKCVCVYKDLAAPTDALNKININKRSGNSSGKPYALAGIETCKIYISFKYYHIIYILYIGSIKNTYVRK